MKMNNTIEYNNCDQFLMMACEAPGKSFLRPMKMNNTIEYNNCDQFLMRAGETFGTFF